MKRVFSGEAGSQSFKKTYKSKLSAAKSEPLLYTSPGVPTITRAAATIDGVELKWKMTPKKSAPYGCYYYIQRSMQESSGYETIASIRQDNDGTLYLFDSEGGLLSDTAFIDTTAEDGQTYYYKVSAFYNYKWYTKPANSAPVKVTT